MHQVGIAKASLYPSLNITAGYWCQFFEFNNYSTFQHPFCLLLEDYCATLNGKKLKTRHEILQVASRTIGFLLIQANGFVAVGEVSNAQ
jgi:hypothetical protein